LYKVCKVRKTIKKKYRVCPQFRSLITTHSAQGTVADIYTHMRVKTQNKNKNVLDHKSSDLRHRLDNDRESILYEIVGAVIVVVGFPNLKHTCRK